MPRVLIISDLHLGDKRNSPSREQCLLDALAALIVGGKYSAVLNLGDTVSRRQYLRNPDGTLEEFYRYRDWRDSLGVPFRECSIYRERSFFSQIFHQPEDSSWDGIPGLRILTLSPEDPEDHLLSDFQWRWLFEKLDEVRGGNVLIGTHVPFPGCCDRPVTPGIYLPVSDECQRELSSFPGRIFWAGGHFHWKDDPPLIDGSLTAFIGGRIAFQGDATRYTYLRELDLESPSVRTIRGAEGNRECKEFFQDSRCENE